MTLERQRYPRYFDALEHEDIVDATDVHTDPRTRELVSDYWAPLGIGATLDAPIRLAGRLYGVLCHEHARSPRMFLPDEKTTACCLGNLASLAFEFQERAEHERRAAATLALCNVAIDRVELGVLVTDSAGALVYHNEPFRRLLRLPAWLMSKGVSCCERLAYIAGHLSDPGELDRVRAALDDAGRGLERTVLTFDDGHAVELSEIQAPAGRVWTARERPAAHSTRSEAPRRTASH